MHVKSIYLDFYFSSACIYLYFYLLVFKIFKILSCITDFLFWQFLSLISLKRLNSKKIIFSLKNIPSPIFRYVNIYALFFHHKENKTMYSCIFKQNVLKNKHFLMLEKDPLLHRNQGHWLVRHENLKKSFSIHREKASESYVKYNYL